MTLIKSLRLAVLPILVFGCAGIADAQTGPTNTASTSSELAMSATVETALQLNISTGAGGATVSGSGANGLFSVGFGTLNGFGTGAPAAGVSVAADATGATYSTPINLTPVYSGFTTETASVSVQQGADANQAIAREGSSAAGMSAVTTAAPVFSGAASGSNNARYVGFRINRAEAAGTKEATLIYTVSMELD